MNTFYIFLGQSKKLNNNSGKMNIFFFLTVIITALYIYMYNIYILPFNYL